VLGNKFAAMHCVVIQSANSIEARDGSCRAAAQFNILMAGIDVSARRQFYAARPVSHGSPLIDAGREHRIV
jgi:hypothetical protein